MSEAAANLMRQADLARRERRFADAHRHLTEAVALCRESSARLELIDAMKGLGQIKRDLGDGEQALPLYEEAVALCRLENDPLLLAHTVRHLGDIHRHARRLELAEPCYHEALALYRSNQQTAPLDLANAIRPLALLKESVGDVEEAKRLWQQARDLYAAVNIPEAVAECTSRLTSAR